MAEIPVAFGVLVRQLEADSEEPNLNRLHEELTAHPALGSFVTGVSYDHSRRLLGVHVNAVPPVGIAKQLDPALAAHDPKVEAAVDRDERLRTHPGPP